MAVDVREWIRLLDSEYLADYVASGGAAVKIAVVAPDEAPLLLEAVRAAAEVRGYAAAHVDAGAVRVHMIDQIFHQVARQIPWEPMAASCVRRLTNDGGIRIEPDTDVSDLEAIARTNGMLRAEVVLEIGRLIRNHLMKECALCKEFRTAISRLCVGMVNPQSVTDEDRAVVCQWLRGEKCSLPRLKQLGIYQRIGRHNARLMLASLARWLSTGGQRGLVLTLDMSAVVTDTPAGSGRVRYARRALLDAYEVLRQFIDGTDEVVSLLVVVAAGPGIIDDPKRSVENYTALMLRTKDEVRDRERPNPLGTMVRLTAGGSPGGPAWTRTE